MKNERQVRARSVVKNCKFTIVKNDDSPGVASGAAAEEVVERNEGLLMPLRGKLGLAGRLEQDFKEFNRNDYYDLETKYIGNKEAGVKFSVNVVRPDSTMEKVNTVVPNFTLGTLNNESSLREKNDRPSSSRQKRIFNPGSDVNTKAQYDRKSQELEKKAIEPIRRYTNLIRYPTRRKDAKRGTITSETPLIRHHDIIEENQQEITPESINEYREFLKKAILSSQSKRRLKAQNDLYTRYQNLINFTPSLPIKPSNT